jgi:hypothetical protein
MAAKPTAASVDAALTAFKAEMTARMETIGPDIVMPIVDNRARLAEEALRLLTSAIQGQTAALIAYVEKTGGGGTGVPAGGGGGTAAEPPGPVRVFFAQTLTDLSPEPGQQEVRQYFDTPAQAASAALQLAQAPGVVVALMAADVAGDTPAKRLANMGNQSYHRLLQFGTYQRPANGSSASPVFTIAEGATSNEPVILYGPETQG